MTAKADPALPTVAELRNLPTAAVLTLPWWDGKHNEGEIHAAGVHLRVPVVVVPDLPVLGAVVLEHGYSVTEHFIVMREWDQQVLLHEVLHVLMRTSTHAELNVLEVGLGPFVKFPGVAKNEGAA
jgi:hypothetical protein